MHKFVQNRCKILDVQSFWYAFSVFPDLFLYLLLSNRVALFQILLFFVLQCFQMPVLEHCSRVCSKEFDTSIGALKTHVCNNRKGIVKKKRYKGMWVHLIRYNEEELEEDVDD